MARTSAWSWAGGAGRATLLTAAAVACASCQTSAGPPGASAASPPAPPHATGASCAALGGTLSVQRRGDGGQYEVCSFPDGRQCEESALQRGECPAGGVRIAGLATPAARYCVITGGAYQTTGKTSTEHEQGTCTFKDGRTCEAWVYFDGGCPPPSTTEPSYDEPFSYCAAVGTVDKPDDRWGGLRLPEAITEALLQQGVLAADAPAESRDHTVWRCMDGEVLACQGGTGLPCLEKADPSLSPSAAMVDYCAANPAAESLPPAVAGRATVYAWGCREGKPVVLRQLFHVDARGFLAELWHVLLQTRSGAADAPAGADRMRVSHDGRLVCIPIDPDNVDPTKELIQSGRFEAHGINVILYQPVGLLPQLLVSGEPEAVANFVKTAREMLLDTGRKHLISISARLTQFSDSEIKDIGINVFPNSLSYSGSWTKPVGEALEGSLNLDLNSSGAGNILVADESLSRGKTLMASQVFTPNGIKAEISDVQHEPAFGTDTYGNIQTNYQDLETNIEVTPVVMTYNAAAPVSARVRLDITVKVSLVSGEKRMATVSAPEYSDKSFKTTRVFPADGRTYLVGSFVSDSDIKSRTGVPVLSSIPILKYLFSQKTTTKSRSYALLTLAVDILPDNLSSDELWRQQGDTAKGPLPPTLRPKGKMDDLADVPVVLDRAIQPPVSPEPKQP